MVLGKGDAKDGLGRRLLKFCLAIIFFPIALLVCVYRYPRLSLATRKKIILGMLMVYALVVIAQADLYREADVDVAMSEAVKEIEIPEGEWLLPDGTCVLNENAELFLQDAADYWLTLLLEQDGIRYVAEDWKITLRGTTYRVKGTAILKNGKEAPFTMVVEADSKARELHCRSILIDEVKYTNIPLVRQKISPEIPQEIG